MLTFLIVAINGWNRIQAGFRAVHPVDEGGLMMSSQGAHGQPRCVKGERARRSAQSGASVHRLTRWASRLRSRPSGTQRPMHKPRAFGPGCVADAERDLMVFD
jgi:hypothetical protein